MATLEDIEHLAAVYSDARTDVAGRLDVMQFEMDRIKHRELPGVKRAVAVAREAQHNLRSALEESLDLFNRPKTRIFHGIKIGKRKQKGSVTIADEDATIQRIERLLPEEQAELLIRVRKNVDKQAVGDLVADDLKRLGIQIEADSEEIVLKPTDSEVDKIVSALLEDEPEPLEGAA